MSAQPVDLRTESGAVSGLVQPTPHGPVAAFLGVPYGTPVRFGRAERVVPWRGSRAATSFGPMAPQQSLVDGSILGDETGCLSVNVWRPEPIGEALPMMVWLHGGGFAYGSNAQPGTSGARLAARYGVVVVGVNYRLGALGFLCLEQLLGPAYHDSQNLAMLDIIDALSWVVRHARALGGDPGNITVFGQSAGGAATATLLGMPGTEGLFRRAIVQSGTAERARTLEYGYERTADLLDILRIPRGDPEQLLTVPTTTLVRAQQELIAARSAGQINGDIVFQPTIGDLLPTLPYESIGSGAHSSTDLIVGTNLNEAAGVVSPTLNDREAASLEESLEDLVEADFPGTADLAERYRAALAGVLGRRPSRAAEIEAYLTDRMQRQPSNRLLDARRTASGRTYSYLFAWASGETMAATHSLEIPFVFDTLDEPDLAETLGPQPPQDLADTMSRAWTSFAQCGVPKTTGLAWPDYGRDRRTIVFSGQTHVEDDPRAPLRQLLQPHGVPARQRISGTGRES